MKDLNYQNIEELTARLRRGVSLDDIGEKLDRFLKMYKNLGFSDRQHLVGMVLRSRLSDQFSIRKEDDSEGYSRQIHLVLNAIIDMVEPDHFNEILTEEKVSCTKKEGCREDGFLAFLLEVMETSRYKEKPIVAA